MDLGLDTRKGILARSLMIESFTSVFIGGLLGIKNLKESKVLGNKSSSLSFNQKIDLLIELGALKANEKNKFQTFMEIRNQFMHNLNAGSYTECFSYLPPGKDTFVLKLYPQSTDLSIEEQLEKASLELASDVLTLTSNIMEHVKNKLAKDAHSIITENSNNAFLESIKETKKMIIQVTDSLIEKGQPINPEELGGFGELVSKLMFSNWGKYFKEFNK